MNKKQRASCLLGSMTSRYLSEKTLSCESTDNTIDYHLHRHRIRVHDYGIDGEPATCENHGMADGYGVRARGGHRALLLFRAKHA